MQNYFQSIVLFEIHNYPWISILATTFMLNSWGNWDSNLLNDLLKVTHQLSSGTGNQTLFFWLKIDLIWWISLLEILSSCSLHISWELPLSLLKFTQKCHFFSKYMHLMKVFIHYNFLIYKLILGYCVSTVGEQKWKRPSILILTNVQNSFLFLFPEIPVLVEKMELDKS